MRVSAMVCGLSVPLLSGLLYVSCSDLWAPENGMLAAEHEGAEVVTRVPPLTSKTVPLALTFLLGDDSMPAADKLHFFTTHLVQHFSCFPLKHLKRLPPSWIASLTPAQVARLTAMELNTLSREQLQTLTAPVAWTCLPSLTLNTMWGLPVTAFPALSVDHFFQLRADLVDVVEPDLPIAWCGTRRVNRVLSFEEVLSTLPRATLPALSEGELSRLSMRERQYL